MKVSVLFAAAILSALVALAAPGTLGPAELAGGATVQTGDLPGQLHLPGGVDVALSPRSTGTVYGDHVVLDSGALHLENFRGYPVNAGDLQVEAGDPASQAVVRLTDKTVEVASLGGSLNVTHGGAFLTHVNAGTRVSFQQSSARPGHARRDYDSENHHKLYWIIGGIAVAALVIGLTAAAQGKSPF